MRSRKPGNVQTGEYSLKKNVVFGNAAAISVISFMQEQSHDPYTYNDTETYTLGDVRFFSGKELKLVTEAETRDPKQFQMIWNQKWEPRLSQRPGYDNHNLLIDKKIITSSDEFHDKFIHLWFDIEEAKSCYEKGIMPSKFIMMRYSSDLQKYLKNRFELMTCRDNDGNFVHELKALVPFMFLKKFELNQDNTKFIGKKFLNANNNYTKSSRSSTGILFAN